MIARRFRMGRSEVHVGEVGFVTKTAFLRERSVLGGFRHESYIQHGRSFVSRMFRETMYPLYLHRVDAKCRSEMANESGVNTISLDACLRFVERRAQYDDGTLVVISFAGLCLSFLDVSPHFVCDPG